MGILIIYKGVSYRVDPGAKVDWCVSSRTRHVPLTVSHKVRVCMRSTIGQCGQCGMCGHCYTLRSQLISFVTQAIAKTYWCV